ncbi:hypothetical protein ACU79E_005194, partial [Escherichia coli]
RQILTRRFRLYAYQQRDYCFVPLLRLSDYGTGWNLDFPAFTILHVTLRLSNLHEFSFAVWWNYE